MCLYEDRVSGRIAVERYDALSARYEEEQETLKAEVESLKQTLNEARLKEQYVTDFIESAKQYVEITEITPQILKQFVRKIYLHEKTEKYSRKKGNQIDIVYAFEMPDDTSQHDLVVFQKKKQ